MNNPAAPLPLSPDDRSTLEKWGRTVAHSRTAPYRVVTRAKTLLMAGDGVANSRIGWEAMRRLTGDDGISFIEGMGPLAGASADLRHEVQAEAERP